MDELLLSPDGPTLRVGDEFLALDRADGGLGMATGVSTHVCTAISGHRPTGPLVIAGHRAFEPTEVILPGSEGVLQGIALIKQSIDWHQRHVARHQSELAQLEGLLR